MKQNGRSGYDPNIGLQYVINACAVGTAVPLKEAHKAETTLVTPGSTDNTNIIRKCYAMGIDNAIHIDDPTEITAKGVAQ